MTRIVRLPNRARLIYLVPICLLALLCGSSSVRGATDDLAFQDCRDLLNQDSDVLPGQVWYKPPVDRATQKAIAPQMRYEGSIIRWTYHINEDGSKTIVVLTRDASVPQPEDDPDGFDIFLERGDVSVEQDEVSANAFAFSAYETDHVNGLLFCTHAVISPEWDWDGHDWGF